MVSQIMLHPCKLGQCNIIYYGAMLSSFYLLQAICTAYNEHGREHVFEKLPLEGVDFVLIIYPLIQLNVKIAVAVVMTRKATWIKN